MVMVLENGGLSEEASVSTADTLARRIIGL